MHTNTIEGLIVERAMKYAGRMADGPDTESHISPQTADSAAETDSVTYTRTGEVSQAAAKSGENISVSV